MSFVEVLPLAIVMIAGPQILSSIFLATSERWRTNSAAYVFGAALSISLVVSIAYLLGSSLGGGGGLLGASARQLLYLAVLVLLFYAAVDTYRKREVSEPPKWMGKLTNATPGFSFRLGFLLLGVFPTNVVTSISVGTFLAANADPVTDAAGFVSLTLFMLALPSLGVLVLGRRAELVLPKIRDWMNDNTWIISEAVIALFVVLTLQNLLG
ncbi:Sap, sulfolipid-1-addressing protein [Halomicrobium zhouii]|uniref:Sap, sulfolipid-1-addressing protein n=1 Tax=Halomicrobium zhouii TaxID=767519 RepID=A0A1I6KNK4_9EURY|nr:GAP family protein [Halomicrobium zhouii]SFR92774.1 Sap, sulfolipid-1-addressing protein [Halomicrobium zhouii]